MVFPGTETIEPLTGRQMERPSTRVLLMRAGRHDLFLRALPHPGCADLWQEVDSECIGKHHDRMGLQGVVVQAHPGQAIDTVRVVIFGYQFGAFPHPAELVEPAAHRVCRHRDAMCGLECQGEGGTAPAGTAPAIGPWGFFEEGAERACEPGQQAGRLDSDGELPVWIETEAQA